MEKREGEERNKQKREQRVNQKCKKSEMEQITKWGKVSIYKSNKTEMEIYKR